MINLYFIDTDGSVSVFDRFSYTVMPTLGTFTVRPHGGFCRVPVIISLNDAPGSTSKV